jgi:hypothetical protein
MAALLAAVIGAAAGIGFYFLNASKSGLECAGRVHCIVRR